METVLKIALCFSYSYSDVISEKRGIELCDVRKIISYELRKQGKTLQEIAMLLQKDHSTVIYQLKGYETLLQTDKNFRKKVEQWESYHKENEMKIILTLDNSKLLVLNNAMQMLDALMLQNQPRNLKSSVSICMELRTEFLQKAIKTRQKDKSFCIKLPYYKADALWRFLNEFEIYFPDNFGVFEKNVILKIKNELHQQL